MMNRKQIVCHSSFITYQSTFIFILSILLSCLNCFGGFMKVLISDNLSPIGVEILKKAGLEVDAQSKTSVEEIEKIIHEYDALVIRSARVVLSPGDGFTPRMVAIATMPRINAAFARSGK